MIEEKPLITVIVPAYKVETYLPICVESIINQTYKNIEIILVDDGSPDRCGTICNEYALKDNRIRVLHKENGGLSSARNAGMKVMKGKFVTFIDSDDYVSPFYVEHLLNALRIDNADLAVSWFTEVSEGEKIDTNGTENLSGYEKLNQKQSLQHLLYQDGIETSAWGKLYKSNLIEGLWYPEGKLYEDIPVTSQYILKSKSVALIRNVDYYYLQRKASIQYQSFNIRKMDGIYHLEAMTASVIEKYPDLISAAYCRELSCACNLLFQIPTDDKGGCREYLWNIVLRTRGAVLKDRFARKKAKLAAGLSFLGYKTMEAVYHFTQSRG
jgi:glycosyltransferase involved in cell wall biosynthesis